MKRMVRKQVYLTETENRLLAARAREIGVTEAEIIRRALDRELGLAAEVTLPLIPDPQAIRALVASMRRRASLPVPPDAGPQKFNREELYEERLKRFGDQSDP